jgi:arylformamidase
MAAHSGHPLPAAIHDISLPISARLTTYPGDPPIEIRPHARIQAGDDANVTRLSFGSHTGTHVDAPHHFLDGGRRVDELALDVLIGPALVAAIPADVTAIGEAELRAAGVEREARVLLQTRNGELPREGEFRTDHAYLTGDGARFLLDAGVRLVGIDYLSVEAFDAPAAEVHRALLARDVIILEGLDLRGVAPGRYELLCLPLRLTGLDGAPARAVLRRQPGGPADR